MSKLLDDGALTYATGKFSIGTTLAILATKTAETDKMITQENDKRKPEDTPVKAQGDAISHDVKVDDDPRFREVSAKGDGKDKKDAVGQPRLDNPTLPGTNVEKDMPSKTASAVEVKDDVRFRKVGPTADKNAKEKDVLKTVKKEAMLARIKSGNISGLAKAAYFVKLANTPTPTNKDFILSRLSTPEGFKALTKAAMVKKAIGAAPDMASMLGGAAGGQGAPMGGGMPQDPNAGGQPSAPEAPQAPTPEDQLKAGPDGLKHRLVGLAEAQAKLIGNMTKYMVPPAQGTDPNAQAGMGSMGGMGPLAGGMTPLAQRIKPGMGASLPGMG